MNFQQIRDFVNPAVGQATGIEAVDTLAMPVPAAHLLQPGGGGSITVDSELSETSTNPVENRVITAALKNSGALGIFPVVVSVDESTGVYVVDKTHTAIYDAIQSGQVPVLYDITYPPHGRVVYQYCAIVTIDDKAAQQFIHFNIVNNGLIITTWCIFDDNTVQSFEYFINLQ